MKMTSSSRFGSSDKTEINELVKTSVPANTVRTKQSVWSQFEQFCKARSYELNEETSVAQLSNILEDWAVNMRKLNGDDYKEYSVKSIWNITAKIIQEDYFTKYNRSFNPFEDIEFKSARDARNAKRKQLQKQQTKRRQSASAMDKSEVERMVDDCNEKTPEGLQLKFFHLVSYELAWRGGEGTNCLTHYFKPEINNEGKLTGRLEYNPVFTKTCQGGNKKLSDSKWLIPNTSNPSRCPVRIFNKLKEKRGENITTDRLFLTPNPFWQTNQGRWYKNCPVGKNEISKWLKKSAEKIGLDTKKRKITNHSSRSSVISHLAKAGVQEQELIKITGHSTASSIKPYLQINEEHHKGIINKIRQTDFTATTSGTTCSVSTSNMASSSENTLVGPVIKESSSASLIFNNCTFYNSFNK